MIKRILGSWFRFGCITPSVPIATAPIDAKKIRMLTPGPTVAFINQSTVVTDAQLIPMVAALQIQVDRDFSPAWKIDANLVFVPKGKVVDPNAWIIYIMDTSDQSGALGYHDLTPAGMPVAKVFAKDDLDNKLSVSVTLSHELLEMLVDPYIQNCVFDQTSDTEGTLYAYEVCDAPEDDKFGYLINGVLVSDFVFPTWFESGRSPNSVRFDFKNVLKAPFSLAPGGYIGMFVVGPNSTGWSQKTAEGPTGQRHLAKLARGISRFHKRKNKGSK